MTDLPPLITPYLEPAAKELCEATDPHPRIYEVPPEKGRDILLGNPYDGTSTGTRDTLDGGAGGDGLYAGDGGGGLLLGNVGDAADPAQRAAVERWAGGDDELLRAHAVWAAARLGLQHVVDGRRDDPSALVRSEVAMAPAVEPAPGAPPTRGTAEVRVARAPR